jgi:hypothetical protein
VKKENKIFFKSVFISVLTFALFVSVGYIFVSENAKKVDSNVESVPYTQETPQNAGILFDINGDKTYFYLNFDENKIIVSLTPEDPFENEIYGYPLDFRVTATSDLICVMADYLNGLELEIEGENYRYTGVQIKDILATENGEDLKSKLIKSICRRILSSRPQVDFFASIIENSQTDLNLVDCYFWDDYITDLCENLYFID